MKEYWVNVFPNDYASLNNKIHHYSKQAAITCAINKPIYRIHVKMKEPKLVTGSEMINHRTTGFKISHDWKVI